MRPGFPHEMAPSSAAATEHMGSTWHSPVPYLFGGLAAMLGLIAFALLILACSYWRISGFLDQQDQPTNTTTTSSSSSKPKPTPYLEEGFVVIMAGDDKPTFLATPVTARPPISPTTFGIDSTGIAGGKVTGEAAEEVEEEEGKGAGDDGTHQH